MPDVVVKRGQVWQSVNREVEQVKVVSIEEDGHVVVRAHPQGMARRIRLKQFREDHRDGYKLIN